MRPVNDLATPAIEELHTWQAQQNPLVRALTAPLIERVTETLNAMQTVIDGQQLLITQLQSETAQTAVQMAALQEQSEATDKEHKVALQVTTDRIDQLERRLFGQKSERRPKTPDARREANQRRRKERTDEQRKAQRQAAANARQDKLSALRTKVITVPLDATQLSGRPLPPETSVLYEWHRGELVRLIIQREKRVLPDGSIATAKPPPQVIEGGSYGPALHAKVAVDKCIDALPLRRQERAMARRGAPLPVSVICALFHRSATSLVALYQAMVADVGVCEHVSADETPQPVLDEDKVRKGWMWVFATALVIVFAYSPSRGGTVPERVLGRSKGTLTVDGHTGYNLVTKEGRRKRGGCWSHGRRGLFEAKAYNEQLVDRLLSQIGELFYTEQLAIEQNIVGTDAHLALRQQRSAPVVEALFVTLEQNVERFDARSSIAKAMRYLLNQKKPLSLFLQDAQVPIHNNLSERALRIVALLRKNALFVGNDESGEHLAMLLSMTATCQLHDVDPELWFADVLLAIGEPGYTAEDLLPWNWKTGRGLTAKPYYDTT